MMTFWTGLLLGWIIGSIGTGLALAFFAGAKDNDDWPHEDYTERLKGRRE
jgi:hypothetical protein